MNSFSSKRAVLGRLSLMAALTVLATCSFAVTIISEDHTDLGITYDPSLGAAGLGMNVHYDPTDEDFDSDDVLLEGYSNTIVGRPAGSSFDFIGTTPGSNIWLLPQSQVPEELYLGIGMDSLDPDDDTFLSYIQSDPRFDTLHPAKWTTVRLLGFSGPGQVSTWTNEIGGPRVLFATSDGLDAQDSILTPIGGDNHFNWAFTAEGDYDLTFQASTFLADGTEIFSPETTYHFNMTTAPVPEPASVATLALGALGMLRRKKRSR